MGLLKTLIPHIILIYFGFSAGRYFGFKDGVESFEIDKKQAASQLQMCLRFIQRER